MMKRGCPQGSSFGPTLWDLHQNDLSYHINEIANLNMYADSHQMYIVGSDMSIMCTNMEKEGNSALKVIPRFCIAHLLLRITRWPP